MRVEVTSFSLHLSPQYNKETIAVAVAVAVAVAIAAVVTLCTSNMDVGSSLKPVVASTMALQHHKGSVLPPKPQNPPATCIGISL